MCIQPSTIASRVACGSPQYPCITEYPRVSSSPSTPTGRVHPVSSTIFTSMWGWTRPTVDTRRSMLSFALDWKETGLVSVMP